jgi:hypothetical protein
VDAGVRRSRERSRLGPQGGLGGSHFWELTCGNWIGCVGWSGLTARFTPELSIPATCGVVRR